MPKLLHESTKARFERKGSRWRAVLITPGQGSSGTYGEAALSESGPAAFPAGTKHWFKHPEKPGEQRDPRDLWGVSAADAAYTEGVGLTSEIEILPHWKEVVDALAESGQAHLSIYAMGESDDDGNITALLPDIKNSVDLVDYPGRPGSGLTEQMRESAHAAYKPDAEASAKEKEAQDMDEVLKAIEALTKTLEPVVGFITAEKDASEKQSQVEADAEAVDKAVGERLAKLDEKFGAIDAAEGLSPVQIESLKAAAKSGADITPLIESAVAIAADFAKLAEASDHFQPGFVAESNTKTQTDDFSVSGWGN